MSGFSAEWLQLREGADHRARNAELARDLAQHFDSRASTTVIDLGSGTGSNLRATAPLLGPDQHWTLIDHEQALLDAALDRLTNWADSAERRPAGVVLVRGAQRIDVALRRLDLMHELEKVLAAGADLVTASALFDIASPEFIARFAAAVSARRSAVYAVLTYDGDKRWVPEHADDAAMAAAFNQHQRRDKGFGPAAGPLAHGLLREALQTADYLVLEGKSPWRLGIDEAMLIAELAQGFTQAVHETGRVPEGRIADWQSNTRTVAYVGHTDLLALPPR